MTNRHVVGAGPFWGHCVFDNHEEVDCYPVYRDPVHDFGILRYDPKAIKYMTVTGLDIKPEQAQGGFCVDGYFFVNVIADLYHSWCRDPRCR